METAHERAVTGKTQENQAQVWSRWIEWCGSIGVFDDIFIENFSKNQRNRLFRAFVVALRDDRFLRPTHDSLDESTIRNTISFVTSTFREHDRRNPTKRQRWQAQLTFILPIPSFQE